MAEQREAGEVLQIEGMNKAFPGVQALSNVHINLRHGEVHALVGENGAGKSTLMKIITGVYMADSGRIFLKGEELHLRNPHDAYDQGIAIIFQESSLFPDLTVLENLFIAHEIRKPIIPGIPHPTMIDYQEMRKQAREVFDRLGMEIDLDANVSELGVAKKQMVEIAKALTYRSNVLILDEPTAPLTNREVEILFETIRRLQSQGVSMIYISHRLDEVFQVADRVTVLRDGQYICTENVQDVTKMQLISWMVGRSLDNLYPKEEVDIGDIVFEARNVTQEGVIQSIDVNVRKGEILGISGLAGAGRTELALALCGLEKPDSAELYINGERVQIRNYRDAMDQGIDYVSEDRHRYSLILAMRLKDNITHKVLHKITKPLGFIDFNKLEQVNNSYMRSLDIKAPDGNAIVNKLSGGNQQKVAVAKSLAVEPQILILDEPTRGVDVGAKSEIHRIISHLAKEGKSIILISSDLPEILGMSDRVLVMKQGRKMGELRREELSQEKILHMAL